MLDNAGLAPTSESTRFTWSGGKITVTDGPSPRPGRSSAATCSPRPRTRPRRWSGPTGSCASTRSTGPSPPRSAGSSRTADPAVLAAVSHGWSDEVVRAASTTAAVETVFRIESARITAGVTRVVRDVGIAEELAQDALVAALEQWPESGVPDEPGAWLMATAQHRAIDLVRRKETYARKPAEVRRALEDVPPPEPADADDADDTDDDLLRLVFTACHSVLSPESRIALTLRLLGGLTTSGSRGRSWCRRPRWRSGASGPSGPWPRPASPSKCRTAPTGRPASPPSWRWSTSSSTRGTPRRRGTTWCARSCARTRSAWPASWRA